MLRSFLGYTFRSYHSRRMRGQQSAVARMDNLFSPISSLIDSEELEEPRTGSYKKNRRTEQLTSAYPSVTKFINTFSIGSPRTSGARRAMLSKRSTVPLFLNEFRPKIEFITCASRAEELPLGTLPEVAFVGRSNVGKSTLINALVGKKICAVANKPGSTEELVFFKIANRLSVVDVPGFGFAYAAASVRAERAAFALSYLTSRKNLRCVFLLIDARHGLADSDSELIDHFKRQKIVFKILINKSDLIDTKTLAKRVTRIAQTLEVPPNKILSSIIPVSALRAQGIDPLRALVGEFGMQRRVVIGGKEELVMDLLEERRKKRLMKNDTPAGHPSSGHSTQFCDIDLGAYTPDPNSIIKRSPVSKEAIRLLEPNAFVSQDELTQMGGLASTAPSLTTIKRRHHVGEKMKLVSENEEQAPKETYRESIDITGFISTLDVESVPKGISRWRVPGLKPRIKTSRFKPKLDTAVQIVRQRPKLDAALPTSRSRRMPL